MTWLDDHNHLDQKLTNETDDELQSAIELAEIDLGDVSMADAVAKLRGIGHAHRTCLDSLRRLRKWLDPNGPNIMALRNAALAAADEARIKSEEAERLATATQAERERAEAAEVQAHDKAKIAAQALAAKKAESAASVDLEVDT